MTGFDDMDLEKVSERGGGGGTGPRMSLAEKQTVSHTALSRSLIGSNGAKVLRHHRRQILFRSCRSKTRISLNFEFISLD